MVMTTIADRVASRFARLSPEGPQGDWKLEYPKKLALLTQIQQTATQLEGVTSEMMALYDNKTHECSAIIDHLVDAIEQSPDLEPAWKANFKDILVHSAHEMHRHIVEHDWASLYNIVEAVQTVLGKISNFFHRTPLDFQRFRDSREGSIVYGLSKTLVRNRDLVQSRSNNLSEEQNRLSKTLGELMDELPFDKAGTDEEARYNDTVKQLVKLPEETPLRKKLHLFEALRKLLKAGDVRQMTLLTATNRR